MTSNAIDAGIGDLTIDSGLAAGALNDVAGGQYAGLDAQQLSIAGAHKEIVFIEDNVPDYQLIAANAGAGREVVILDSSKDGLQQIADALQGRSGIDGLHVVTHGAEGEINLGSLTLDAASAAEHSGLLHTIGQSLAPGGDILLYGCNVAAGQGIGFVDQLAIATGADVAASNDLTGDATRGGDWNLEVATGGIETAPVVNAALAAQYHDLLSISTPTTVTFSSIPNSYATNGPSVDLSYAIPGYPGYTLKFDGDKEGVGSYSYSNNYIVFSPAFSEDKITIGFTGGQVFTPTSVKVNGNASNDQTLVFTGLGADGSEITHTDVHIPVGASITDFVTQALSGFTNISTLVITPQPGNAIQYFQMDDLVLANAQVPPPTVVDVSASTANGAYKAGDVIHITVDFDQAVTVDTTGGTPQLKLETGATDHSAVYASGSGSSTLTFNYTVQAGDTSADLDYFSTAALSLNGATIRSSGGSDATLTLTAPGNIGSLGVNKAIVIDTTAPAAPSTPDLAAASDSGTSSSDNLTKIQTPTLTGSFADSDVTTVKFYDTDGVTQVGSGTVSGGSYSIALSTPLSDGLHTITAKAIDAAGNVSAASGGLDIVVDTTPPTVTVSSDTSSTLKIGDASTITFTFSEDPGASFTAGDVSVSGGTLGALSGSGATRTATFTPSANTDNGTAHIGVNAASYADAAGNNGGAGAPLTINYDTKAPTLTISSDQASLKSGESATITFTFSDDPGANASWDGGITVSGGTLSAIGGSGLTRTATFTPTADVDSGTASIAVGAGAYQDTAGNASTAASLSFGYDTLSPGAPSAPVLAPGSDSGVSSTDGVTNKDPGTDPLIFSGSADAGATVRLYDGATEIGHATADGGGVYDIAVFSLAEGSHTVTAQAYDAAGNASTASGATTVVVDHTPPATVAAGATLSSDTGSSATDMITSTASQTISGTLSANLAAGERVMVSLDNGATWTAATATVGQNTWSLAATLAGSDTLKVHVEDLAGNAGTDYAHAYAVDTVAPATVVTGAALSADTGSSATDMITSTAAQTISGTLSANLAAGEQVMVSLDNGATWTAATASAGQNTWSLATTLTGSDTLAVQVVDAAGNAGATYTHAYTLDTVALTTAIASAALSSDTGSSATDMITSAASQTISGTLSANLATGERVMVSLDNGATWTAATATVGQNTWSLAATLTGSDTLKVHVEGQAGNAGMDYTHAYTLDTAAPATAVTSAMLSADTGSSATDMITSTAAQTISGTLSANLAAGEQVMVSLDNGATWTAATATAGQNTWSLAATLTGSDTLAVQVVDQAGNVGATYTHAYTLDTAAPATTVTSAALSADTGSSATDMITSAASQTISGTLSANLATGERVMVSLDNGATWTAATATVGQNTWSLAATLTGSDTLKVHVEGQAGNAGTDYTHAYTLDTTSPTLTITSSAATLKAGDTPTITFTFSEDPGASFTTADVVVSGGTLSALSGSGATRTAILTPDANVDGGTASITVAAGAYADAAGNTGAAGVTPSLQFDTLAPPAPSAPALDPASDSGAIGDGVTTHTSPVIDGTALANARVVLYDTVGGHTVQIGTATADASGHWSITAAGLANGNHALSVTQLDAAGNASAASAAFALTIQAPTTPTTLIDGVPVAIQPVVLPGGASGSEVSIPIVSTGRVESSGQAGVADIPIVTNGQGGNLLLAQLSPGFGLSASGANVSGTSASELLLAAIKAATPTHAADDQGHLTANGQSFLDGLAAGSSLLVETVKPVGGATTPDGALTLSGPAAHQGQDAALVIDTSGLASGNTINLQQVNFAAVIGAANVVAQGGNTVLSGDAASQHFTVAAGGSGAAFGGAGDDVLSFGASSTTTAPAAGVTLLHGGADKDVATFSGAESDYNLDYHNGYVVVSSKAAPNVQALVVNVEQLQFSDASVTIQDSGDMDTLAAMYQTVLGRQADMKGIEYWEDTHQSGVSWGAIALSMVASSEHVAGHGGFDGDAAHDLTLLYSALFDRAPDAAGLAYWTGVMNHGETLEQVANAMVQSSEMTGHQITDTGWNFSV